MLVIVSFAAVLALAGAHLAAGNLRFLQGYPRSVWLSIAGGVSVAYIFIHLLPELSAGQEVVGQRADQVLGMLDRHVYLIALAGLAIFYGLEGAARSSRRGRSHGEGEDTTTRAVFRLHTVSYSVYNVLIGYLLLRRPEGGVLSLVLFATAMLVHFVVNDYGLREHHKAAYTQVGRWVLAAAVIVGWLLSLMVELPETLISLLIAFLAGGVLLNVLKEELPEERASRFWAFLLGAAAYAALLLAV